MRQNPVGDTGHRLVAISIFKSFMDIAYKIFISVLPELIEKLVWCFLTAIFVGTGATNIFSANTRYYQSNYSTDFISWNQNLIAFEEH